MLLTRAGRHSTSLRARIGNDVTDGRAIARGLSTKWEPSIIEQNRDRLTQTLETPSARPARTGLDKIPFPVAASHGKGVQNTPENVIGYMPVPLASVGPITVNGRAYHVPLANAESSLVSRTNLGCRAIEAAGGVFATVSRDCLVLSPLVTLPSDEDASQFAQHIGNSAVQSEIKEIFRESTGSYELSSVSCNVMGPRMFVRFTATCGDNPNAVTMSKGVERVFLYLKEDWKYGKFDTTLDILEARDMTSGKCVSANVILPIDALDSILGIRVEDVLAQFVEKQRVKAKIMQGALARKLVLSMLLATGQDIHQPGLSGSTIEISCEPIRSIVDENLITGLQMSCTIPSIEVATVGGKASVGAHHSCLDMLDLAGSNMMQPGANSQRLAEIICATVLAGELGGYSRRTLLSDRQSETGDSATNIGRQRASKKLSFAFAEIPKVEAARGLTTSRKLLPSDHANVGLKARENGNNAYIELVAEKCAAEFGWADPRLTVP